MIRSHYQTTGKSVCVCVDVDRCRSLHTWKFQYWKVAFRYSLHTGTHMDSLQVTVLWFSSDFYRKVFQSCVVCLHCFVVHLHIEQTWESKLHITYEAEVKYSFIIFISNLFWNRSPSSKPLESLLTGWVETFWWPIFCTLWMTIDCPHTHGSLRCHLRAPFPLSTRPTGPTCH